VSPVLVKRNENDQHECELAKMMKGGFGMNIFKYFVVSSVLLLQTSLCFARSDEVINFYVSPDPITHCNGYGVDVAITENSTLGIVGIPECISDRPTFYGSSTIKLSNKLNRMFAMWKYSPHGVFEDGYFLYAVVGADNSEFKSAAGSTANVSFIDTGTGVGYHWFWHNGFNVTTALGVAHLIQNSIDKSISSTESVDTVNYLDQQTRTNTHAGVGLFFGWAF